MLITEDPTVTGTNNFYIYRQRTNIVYVSL